MSLDRDELVDAMAIGLVVSGQLRMSQGVGEAITEKGKLLFNTADALVKGYLEAYEEALNKEDKVESKAKPSIKDYIQVEKVDNE
jgi:hypothetical protein